jgi:hypothetical protein
VAVDEFSNIYIAGAYSRSATFGSVQLSAPADVIDALLTKLDTEGNVIWAKSGNHAKGSNRYSSVACRLGKIHVTGYSEKSGFNYDSKPLVASYNYGGSFNWKTGLGEAINGRGILLSTSLHHMVLMMVSMYKY